MAEAKIIAPYDMRTGEMTPTQIRDAIEVQAAKGQIFVPENLQHFRDIQQQPANIAVYPDCDLVCISDASENNAHSLFNASFIENSEAVSFISSVRTAAQNRRARGNHRLLRHTWLPASGIPASAAGWSADVLAYGGTLPPELFVITALSSALATLIKGGANNWQDHKRGGALQSMLRSGWRNRQIFYPKADSQPSAHEPIEFEALTGFELNKAAVGDDAEVWDYAAQNHLLVPDEIRGHYNLRLSRLFFNILANYPKERADLWRDRLRKDMEFYQGRLKDVKRVDKESDLLKRTEEFTRVVDENKRAEISQKKADLQASVIDRTTDLLKDLRERALANAAREKALELEKLNHARIGTYDTVGKWAQMAQYPVETHRGIQTVLNGAMGLKDSFIAKYGIEEGLKGVVEFDGYIRTAVQLLSKGASFGHIYQGICKHFGEAAKDDDVVEPKYAVALPALEDFQRVYAPEHEQVPAGAFGELYPGAFYNIAISMSEQPSLEAVNSDLR